MILVSFSVENYRSITKANRIEVGHPTVLVGPNNEGKSNILRALVTAMEVLTASPRGFALRAGMRLSLSSLGSRNAYQWEKDFPIHLQKSKPEGFSSLSLEFKLDPEEIEEFKKEVGSNLNGLLPIVLELSRNGLNFSVTKKGKGAKSLALKANPIARFIANRIEFEYIRAIRTAESANSVVKSLVEKELSAVERQDGYLQALETIKKLQQPVLDALSKSVHETMVGFLPAIKKVRFEITEEQRFTALRRSAKIIIDDGTPTDLAQKGDGVQSLAALALMRHASVVGGKGKSFVIAIEEPESHLHPKAMHVLRKVINELAEKYQVVITTHSPLFVDRMNVESNVIVNQHKAIPAKSIDQIRNILGVRASDNLQHAELVLVVEGDEDKTALRAILRNYSSTLADAIDGGKLAFETLSGGTNLSYVLGLLRDALLCTYHCFLDYDKCGRESFEKAKAEGLVDLRDVNFASVAGLKESEIEDLYEFSLYKDLIWSHFRVGLDGNKKFKSNKKWSDRLGDAFIAAGKPWNEAVEMEVKSKVASAVAANPSIAVNLHKKEVIENLAAELLEKLKHGPGIEE
jgi:predicted ATPase